MKSKKLSKRAPKAPTAIDLFSGCGGLTAGLVSAGFEVVAAVELDERACDTYQLNHKNVRLYRKDIRKVSPKKLMEELQIEKGELGLLACCPPCQSFSRIRKLNRVRAAKDKRNALIFDVVRFARALSPHSIMLENVPGLAKHYRFDQFCKKLESLGYKGAFKVLDAAEYGVAQRRRRLIYVASKSGVPELAKAMPSKKSVRNVIRQLPRPGKSGDPLHDIPTIHSEEVRDRIRNIPKNGGSRADLPRRLQLECHKNSDGFKDVYGRMAWDDVAPTITGGCFNPSKGRFLHPSQNRAITMREAAMLQGFPRRYKFDVKHGKSAIALMIGNALPPPFIAAHAKALRKSVLL